MRVAVVPRELLHALRAIDRKRPCAPRKDREIGLTATANGLTLDTNATTAFVLAHVAVAGACTVPRQAFIKVLGTYPGKTPLTLAVVGGRLHIGRLRMPCGTAFAARER